MCVSDASLAHARGRVGVRLLFAMRLSLVHGPRPRSTDRELTMDCRHCGNVRDDARETVPYVGPGPRVVELRDVQVTRCRVCAHMTIDVPEPSHLDTLIRCLRAEIDGPLPQLAYEMGHWCILPRPPGATGATAQAS